MRRNRIAAGVLSALLMWHAAPTAAATPVELPPLLPGQVLRIGPAAGTGTLTADYGIGATDLCEAHQASETGDDFRDHSRVEFSLLDPGHEEPEGEIVDPFE